ncbi:MAG: acyl-CoA thioesterase [Acidobacteriota bacterium]
MSSQEGVVRVRVRYPEVDRMGVAHHTVHLIWFEIGRTEWLRSHGLPYARIEAGGIFLPVIEARCAYHAPARYDDVLIVRSAVAASSRARVTFTYRVEREADGALLATGRTTHAAVDGRGRPRPLPDPLRELLG